MNSEALQLAGVAKIIRSRIFQVEKAFEFANKFPPNCQTDCVCVDVEIPDNLSSATKYNNSHVVYCHSLVHIS